MTTMKDNIETLTARGEALDIVSIDNEQYFKIANINSLRPFFMTIVSDSDHWMFISSNGGLTAGRKNADYSLFPYYTDDKITETAEITGSKTIFQVSGEAGLTVWEPFSERYTGKYRITRNLYKNVYGNKIIFEEVNESLGLLFRYQWSSSNRFGFVRKSTLVNLQNKPMQVNVLDGIQNILPYGINSDLQNAYSNLVDAYKRNELHQPSGLGIFALSAIIVDKAEPSEALKANIAWSTGLGKPVHLLSSLQLNKFRNLEPVQEEQDIKGEKGAYFVAETLTLPAEGSRQWKIVANVNQTQSQVVSICETIAASQNLDAQIEADIEAGTQQLLRLNAAVDGIQYTADPLQDARHFSNVLFNIMRGGIFDNNYQIEKSDFLKYLHNGNKQVAEKYASLFEPLAPTFSQAQLAELIHNTNDPDLIRLGIEYLPLKFSRRHGDPSRPWNRFSINTRNESDGSKVLDYQGNWRDIFQNWEALAHSYPDFIEGMIFKFLNASTFDGYNPYRVTKDGFDWETIEPDDPWSYIGYWGDHQIIYLLKFLEFSEAYFPGKLNALFDKEWFVYAAVPYKIKPYEQILQNPKDTISFDHHWDAAIRAMKRNMGADGALLQGPQQEIYRVNFIEKILATVLAKLSNLIPEGGIWMNTQRPEWNDANNALVGNGVSMVTLYYLHRFLQFFKQVLDNSGAENIQLSSELATFFSRITECLQVANARFTSSISNKDKKRILDQLGQAASDYRLQIYAQGFSGEKTSMPVQRLRDFTHESLLMCAHTIQCNQRPDKLYHAYNLVSFSGDELYISHLSEMLEGQVAVLSAGCLSAQESLEVLDALRNSALYRADQDSYILYPNKVLPGFLQKNIIEPTLAASSGLLMKLVADGHTGIIERDVQGNYHFNGNFRNASDLALALDSLQQGKYRQEAEAERALILDIFEQVFNHKAFTGRSGTFYGYEGLGSIYWHMVSKLLLAAQECCTKAMEEKAKPAIITRLVQHYYDIKAGIGVHKTPARYGAFPTDPYSHTPAHRGAQQPGMTGQVKEDVLVRRTELGVAVKQGRLHFMPHMLKKDEFLPGAKSIAYTDIAGNTQQLEIAQQSLMFTCCQVPVTYSISDVSKLTIAYANGKMEEQDACVLDEALSRKLFQRTGEIRHIHVSVNSLL